MAYGTRVVFEELRELGFASITASYTPMGLPTNSHVRLISISNSTEEDIYISFDGITDHLRLTSLSFKLFDLSSNKVRDDGLFIEVGTQVYVKYVSNLGTQGSVWMEALSAEGGK